ncbi:hypothetical protein BIW11_12420 [Tropilaelaps mercedesae]|uniref:Uncharacterized protein n=1 Tax=Tropilaelaps mercedesae TaxID=418985 RepID=A0A1V9X735_9ACAR|nr:hypothetical protein BIW11_12420 [Tropilaelaps mercedesae]
MVALGSRGTVLVYIVTVLVGIILADEDSPTTNQSGALAKSRIRCDAMERFNCVRACRGIMRTTCVKQGDGTYLCVCFNGDIYGNHDRTDGQVVYLSNVFGRTTKAPFPYYLEPLHLQHGRRGGVSDPCDPRSRFRHIFNYEERIAHEKNNDVNDRVFL